MAETPEKADASNELDGHEIRILKKQIADLKKRLIGTLTGERIIVRAVEQSYSDPPELIIPRAPKFDKSKKPEEIAVLHISDVHFGKTTHNYDSATATERIHDLIKKTIKITDIRRSTAKINEIRVYLGGDLVEGEEIFPTQAHHIDESVFDQAVKTAPSVISSAILSLMEHFNKVKVVCVPGNHGRNGPKSTRAHPRTNWDNIAYAVIKLMIMGPIGNERPGMKERVEFVDAYDDPKAGWFAVDRVFDWGNLIVHGHEIRGGFAGFPWYGTAKKAWGWIDTIPHPWDYLWFGHFHTYASAVLNHRTFLANGTTESGNEYAAANMAAAGFPCQRLCFFNRAHGIIADHQVFLTDERIPIRNRALQWLS